MADADEKRTDLDVDETGPAYLGGLPLAVAAGFSAMPQLLAAYRTSLRSDLGRLLETYEYVHVARKVVGVGSVGTRTWLGVVEVPDHSCRRR